MGEVGVRITPTLKRMAVIMMADPFRIWTPAELKAATDRPVENYLFKFRKNQLIKYSIFGDPGAFALTETGRRMLSDVLDRLSTFRMTGTQQIHARTLARQIVDGLPEAIADRVMLTRDNVIHVITESGEPYALTITPR